jgi:hypothetical protein
VSDILDEVLNDQKDEKRLKAFRKLLPIIITVTLIVVIVIASYNWYSTRLEKHNQDVGDLLIKLISKHYGSEELTTTALENIINTSENHQAELAAIKLFSNSFDKGNKDEAMAMLEDMVSNKKYHEITNAFSAILWLNLVLDQDKLSTENEVKIREYFQYFKNDSQPFYATSLLLKALFYQKIKQPELAKESAEAVLALPNVTEITKEQARAILAFININ